MSWLSCWLGPRATRHGSRHELAPMPAWVLATQQRHENFNNFFIWTPILMILGLLESQRRALKEYAEKHHSPSFEDKTKWKKVRPLDKRTTDKTTKPKHNMIFIRTLFSMILGLYRRYSQAL